MGGPPFFRKGSDGESPRVDLKQAERAIDLTQTQGLLRVLQERQFLFERLVARLWPAWHGPEASSV
jgi:hypothetical protein